MLGATTGDNVGLTIISMNWLRIGYRSLLLPRCLNRISLLMDCNVIIIIINIICLFVCCVIYFEYQIKTAKIFRPSVINRVSPEVASIVSAYLRNTRLGGPHHSSPATR